MLEDKIEVLQDKVLCCKYETELLEGESQNRKEEIKALQIKCNIKSKSFNNKEKEWLGIKYNCNEKIKILNEALKTKSRQLAEYLN